MTIYKKGEGLLGISFSKALKPGTLVTCTYAFLANQEQGSQPPIYDLSAEVLNDHEARINLTYPATVDLSDPDSDAQRLRDIEYWLVFKGMLTLARFKLVYKLP
jgi:hypothetical protein